MNDQYRYSSRASPVFLTIIRDLFAINYESGGFFHRTVAYYYI